jgi:2-iminobutanoate/2-iminopropanoate deaminase
MARRSIETDSFRHSNPIPGASLIGPMLQSGFVTSFNPGERSVPSSFEDEVANVFTHMGNLLEAAGGTFDDVLSINFFVAEGLSKSALNDAWLAHFPDEDARPARWVSTRTDFPLDSRVGATFNAYIER